MSAKLFISREGKTLGPFPEEKIRELFEKGKLEPQVEIWPEGAFAQKTTVEAYFGPKGKSAAKEKSLYVSIDGKVKGPFPESKIRAMLDAGEVHPDDHVCDTEGNAKWLEASAYFGFESATSSLEEDEADTYVGDEEDLREEARPAKSTRPEKKKKDIKEISSDADFGTPDVVFILKNLNDGTFLKNFTGALVMVIGLLLAIFIVYFIGNTIYFSFSASMPVFLIIARTFLAVSLIYPTYFLAVSCLISGLRIRNVKTSEFVTAPIASIIIETLANNCLIFGFFMTIPLTMIYAAFYWIQVGGMEAISEGGKCFGGCVLWTVGAFFLAKFWKEFLMVFFVIREDVEAIRNKAEETK